MSMKTMRKSKPKRTRCDFNEEEDYVYPTKKVRQNTRRRRQSANIIQAGLLAYECPEDEDGSPMSDLVEDQEIMDDYNKMITEFNEAEIDAKQQEEDRDIKYHETMSDIYDPWDHMGYDEDDHVMPDGPAPF